MPDLLAPQCGDEQARFSRADEALRFDTAPQFIPQTGKSWNVFALLKRFCVGGGASAPNIEKVAAAKIPALYRGLLAHSQDMTPTLERHFGTRAGLQVLRRQRADNAYWREVTLTVAGEKPVEYGIIKIYLHWFSRSLQEQILQEKLPLGRLLEDHAVPHLCWPQGFYALRPNTYLQTVLALDAPATLYARRNVMLDSDRRLIADVLEILSPEAERPSGSNRSERKTQAAC